MKKASKGGAAASIKAILMGIVIILIVALVASIGYFSGQLLAQLEKDEELYFNKLYTINTTLINADRDFYQAMLAATELATERDKVDAATVETMVSDYEENKQQALDNVEAATAIAKSDPDLFTGTKSDDGDTYESLFAEYEDAYKVWLGTYDPAAGIGDLTAFNNEFFVARGYLSEMQDVTEKWALYEVENLESTTIRSIIISAVIFGIIALVLLIFSIIMATRIATSMKQTSKAVSRMAGGDFVRPLHIRTMVSEINDIVENTEGMRARLQEALSNVIMHAGDVNQKAEETKDRITDSQQMTSDIDNAVGDLAEGATMMAQDVQGTNDVTISIGDSVDRVYAAANENLEKGRTVYDNSVQVQGQLEELKKADQLTDEMAGRVADSVEETAEAVEQISQAAEAIIGIASQTNLLALNASIEAARAGEAGKGFAVVADNIKNLAEDSNRAAGEITDILSHISELSDNNKELTGRIKEATTSEAASLQEMMAAFEQMLGLLRETEEGNKEIVSLVESLNTDKNSILNSVESLSSVSEENAASTEQTSASLTQLDSNMETVASQAESLQEIATMLQENVSFFKVREEDIADSAESE